jgi:hypothetical protein
LGKPVHAEGIARVALMWGTKQREQRAAAKALSDRLFSAVESGSVASVELLLREGASANAMRRKSYPRVNKKSKELHAVILPRTVLATAVYLGHVDVVRVLLGAGAKNPWYTKPWNPEPAALPALFQFRSRW